MNVLRKIVKINHDLCNGCGNCIIDCHEAAIELVNNKAVVLKDSLCDGLGDCLGNCPTDAITIEEREAEPYNEEEVHQRIKAVQDSASATSLYEPVKIVRQWPLKIRLVSPEAEIFEKAHLVIAADCAAFNNPDFHRKYRNNNPIIIGCPKFEDPAIYEAKLGDIFARANITGCTVVRMEVPCCSGLARAVERAAERHGVKVDIQIMEINR